MNCNSKYFSLHSFQITAKLLRTNITWQSLAVIWKLWRENYFELQFMNWPKSAIVTKHLCYAVIWFDCCKCVNCDEWKRSAWSWKGLKTVFCWRAEISFQVGRPKEVLLQRSPGWLLKQLFWYFQVPFFTSALSFSGNSRQLLLKTSSRGFFVIPLEKKDQKKFPPFTFSRTLVKKWQKL